MSETGKPSGPHPNPLSQAGEGGDQAQRFKTSSGIEIGRYYGPESIPADYCAGSSGSYPFTRGIQKDMYRGRLWTMRQYAGFGTAKKTNERFRWLLSQGQSGLSTAFDLPTQLGLDADDPQVRGEIGRVGVHIGTLADMEELFQGIALAEVSTSLTINATAIVLLAFYVALAKRRAISLDKIRGTLQNDILKEFIARGAYIYALEPSLRLAVDSVEYSIKHIPHFNPISISGYHIREAGSDAVQEIAFTFANAEVYLKEISARGLSIDQCGPRLAFFFGCHSNFLEEIAKFRAARRVWAKMMKDDYGSKDPKTQALRFHVQTCGSTLTSRQPMNNVARVSLQAMAAILGGAQSLHTNSYDEALGLPTEESAGLALRTQQILAHETGIPDTVDPVGGSYAIESLTSDLERRIWETIRRARSSGGMLAMIAQGAPQAEIQQRAYEHEKMIESGVRKTVGVNCYNSGAPVKERARSILKISPKFEAGQKRKLKRFKAERSQKKAAESLKRLDLAAASPKENLFPAVLSCVESEATLGEICGVLKGRFGEYNGR